MTARHAKVLLLEMPAKSCCHVVKEKVSVNKVFGVKHDTPIKKNLYSKSIHMYGTCTIGVGCAAVVAIQLIFHFIFNVKKE